MKVLLLVLFSLLGLVLSKSLDDGITLQLVIVYPDENLNGKSIFLRGDGLGLNWKAGQIVPHSTKSNEWVWSFTYTVQDVGRKVQFKTLIGDSLWQIGGNEIITLPSSSGTTVTSYPFYFSQQGSYWVTTTLHSDKLKNDRDVIVYIPPSYQENSLKIYTDVLIMHDGENLFNDSTSFGGIAWRCQDTVDRLINEGTMREIIIVGLYNTAARIDEYTYSYDASVMGGGKGDLYLDFIEDKAIPWIQSNLRISSKVRYGIMGSSLGGIISCYAGWTRPSVYAIAGCMSSSFWWNNQDFNNTILNKPRDTQQEIKSGQTIFYLDSGDQGDSQDDKVQTLTVRSHFQSLGWTLDENLFYYLMKGGSHNERSWGTRFYVPMTYLYPVIPLD